MAASLKKGALAESGRKVIILAKRDPFILPIMLIPVRINPFIKTIIKVYLIYSYWYFGY